MDEDYLEILKNKLGKKDHKKIFDIKNQKLHKFIAKYIQLCNPSEVFVSSGSTKDIRYIRDQSIRNGEEIKINKEGQTVHFDGYNDQARDKKNTKLFVSEESELGSYFNVIDKKEGFQEIHDLLKNIMKGHELYIGFYCLGPVNSDFSILAVQLTDSSYVAHSENLLYRQGYEEFKRMGESGNFFKFVHSQGELSGAVSKNIDKRRIYIDTEDEIVYSVNTQYGGNTIGLKKLAMRLAINRSSKEGWLTEHMFIMGVHGPNNRTTYFTGAYPSMCGKTSTAMLERESIVGDDIAYLKKKDGKIYAVNVEKGVFGIIQDVNAVDDPIIFDALDEPGEIIFSNILITEDNSVYWIGKDKSVPLKGINYSGEWYLGKIDAEKKEILPSHKNARFTLDLKLLQNVSSKIDNPIGVEVGGIIYGGRDSDTWVPVEESFDWIHGIITKGASLESETTAATLGKAGIRSFNPMSNLDFLSISIGSYIENNLKFGSEIKYSPPIFSVNYFIKDSEGRFMNDKNDKKVWLKWMELRSHKEVEAIETPTGLIPKFDDLKRLFKEVLNKEYTREEYIEQFKIRVQKNLEKVDRIINIYQKEVNDAPETLFKILKEQKTRLIKAKEIYGDYINPDELI